GLNDLGSAKKVLIEKDNTTIVEGAGEAKALQGRIAQIKREIEDTSSDYDREKLQERLAKLSGGVAQINVGAATEIEMKEKKARLEDALHATRAAVEEGILPGGGVALLRCETVLDAIDADDDLRVGINIVRRALSAPLRQIANNAGCDGSIIVQQVREADSYSAGYNAATGEHVDLIEAGIIDPTKVVRSALQNAASIASIMLSIDAVVSEIPEESAAMPAGGGGMPGGMGGMGGGMGGMY
ncbi:chaperonin GroEL, partial [bacterium AH-315-M10]|nr:chaperonin GroEL [bacterium AH-315-M10]